MKLILISGMKHSKKDLLAHRLASNSDCIWIKPFTDRKMPVNAEPSDDVFIKMNQKQLDDKMEREVPFASTVIKGSRYVFFENQLNADYVVLVCDDRMIQYIQNTWNGEYVSIRCHSDKEEYSDRWLMQDHEFDYVFHYDHDDYDTLEALII